jgi:hypothetical protein
MPVPIPTVHLGLGCAATLLSLPLVLRKIPMNRIYGIRVPLAFVSERNWYAINAYGGKWLFAVGLLLLAFGFLGRDFAPPPTSLWAPAYMILPLLALVPMLAFIRAYVRRLSNR